MAKPRITLRTPYNNPGTLVFRCQNVGEIPTTSPPTVAPNRGGVGHISAFRPISRYISETVQDREQYYRKLIETCMRCIECRYFQ